MNIYHFIIDSEKKALTSYACFLANDNQTFTYSHSVIGNRSESVAIFLLPNGKTKIIYDDHQLIFDLSEVKNTGTFEERTKLTISYSSGSKKKAMKLLCKLKLDAVDYLQDMENNVIVCSYVNGEYIYKSKLPKRNLDTIYLENKRDIILDIDQFILDENLYKNFGLPYNRKYLLEGPSATGKTSLIIAIASYLKKNIYVIDSDNIRDLNDLSKAVSNVFTSQNIIVFENIEQLFTKIDSELFFNMINGLYRREKTIFFMTTTKFFEIKENIDMACIDLIINFVQPKKNQIKEMFE